MSARPCWADIPDSLIICIFTSQPPCMQVSHNALVWNYNTGESEVSVKVSQKWMYKKSKIWNKIKDLMPYKALLETLF